MQTKIIPLLKEAFPTSHVSESGNSVTIRDGIVISYLIFVDDLVFRSGPHGSIQSLADSINNFLGEHKKDPIIKCWYLPKRTDIWTPKNRDLYLNFSYFELKNEREFYKAFPAISPLFAYKRGKWNDLDYTGFVTSCIQLVYRLGTKAKSYWIDKIVLVFRSNIYLNDYYLDNNEGVGYHLLEMMIRIYQSYDNSVKNLIL